MREYISLSGKQALHGEVRVAGAKNAALPLLFATLLTEEPCVLANVPDLDDIAVTLRLLDSLGAKTSFNEGTANVECSSVSASETPYALVKRLRASFWAMGPLLARVGEAKVALPGGDAIGTRPVDLHLKGFMRMGAEIRMQHGAVVAHAPGGLHPAHIVLEYPSVGATHNLMMAAALTPGVSIIDGAAREPEVVELAHLLNQMGAEIDGDGTSVIRIRGKEKLSGAKIQVLGDRIEAATYLVAGAVTGGNVSVCGIEPEALQSTLRVLSQMGVGVEATENQVLIQGPERLKAASFETAPYPGLATDVQPLLMAALAGAEGMSTIKETVFENRFGHVAEYRRLGADIAIAGQVASIRGVDTLSAAPVEATDIRAAAGLVIMGLQAEGETAIHDIHHLDRGYEGMVDKLQALGAQIRRVPEAETKELVFGC